MVQPGAGAAEAKKAEGKVMAQTVAEPLVDVQVVEHAADATAGAEALMAKAAVLVVVPMEAAGTVGARPAEAVGAEKAAAMKAVVADTSRSRGCCSRPSGSCEPSSSMTRLQRSHGSCSRCAAPP